MPKSLMPDEFNERLARMQARRAEGKRWSRMNKDIDNSSNEARKEAARRTAEGRLKSLGVILDGLYDKAVDIRVLKCKINHPENLDARASDDEMAKNLAEVVWQIESLARVVTDLAADVHASALDRRSHLTNGKLGVHRDSDDDWEVSQF